MEVCSCARAETVVLCKFEPLNIAERCLLFQVFERLHRSQQTARNPPEEKKKGKINVSLLAGGFNPPRFEGLGC